jgi:DNA-binding MarR family transcriptional regulator
MRTTAPTKKKLAAQVWRLMRDFSLSATQRGHHIAVLKELGLTPGHLKILGVLQPGELRPMGALAEACSCDASMATWLVDRLEDRGLVERRMVPADRRVKAVALTAVGVQTKERLFAHLDEPPVELLALSAESLETLRTELSKLPHRPLPWSEPASAQPAR